MDGQVLNVCGGGWVVQFRPFFDKEGVDFVAEYTIDKDCSLLKFDLNKTRLSCPSRSVVRPVVVFLCPSVRPLRRPSRHGRRPLSVRPSRNAPSSRRPSRRRRFLWLLTFAEFLRECFKLSNTWNFRGVQMFKVCSRLHVDCPSPHCLTNPNLH